MAEAAPDWNEFPLLADAYYFPSVSFLQSSAHSFMTRAIMILCQAKHFFIFLFYFFYYYFLL